MAKALLIIDFQNDFTSGGALEVPGGDEIAEPVKRLADRFDLVFATRDWHPPDHASFETQGGPWPVHCVQGTHGAEFHPAMARSTSMRSWTSAASARTRATRASRSPTWRRSSATTTWTRCTSAAWPPTTASGRRRSTPAGEGFEVTVVEDAVRAVEVNEGDSERAFADMRDAGAKVAGSGELSAGVAR